MVDLGCIETIKIARSDLQTARFTHGIMFVWQTEGCFSTVGVSSQSWDLGYQGAKDTWQVISLAAPCEGSSESTVHHEVLHALGVHHEQARPDRDEYIVVNLNNTDSDPFQFDKININEHEQTDLGSKTNDFELASVMMYGSGGNSTHPVMTLLDGSTFYDGFRLTTADAKQIQWKYCRNITGFSYKETVDCTSKDRLGFEREVFKDRICDGRGDCPGGEDETSFARCVPGNKTANGCCSELLLDGVDICRVNGTFNGADAFVCDSSLDNRIVRGYDNWYRYTDWSNSSSSWYDAGTNGDGTNCPPVGKWTLVGEHQVFCTSIAADYVDDCATVNCHPNATCEDLIQSFKCTCNEGYIGDGVICNACTSKDPLAFDDEIFNDIICNGFADCPGEEDEISIARCVPAKMTSNGCCSELLFDGVEKYTATGTYDGKDAFVSENSSANRIVMYGDGNWYRQTDWPSSYRIDVGTIGNGTICPPVGTWTMYGKHQVFCTSINKTTTTTHTTTINTTTGWSHRHQNQHGHFNLNKNYKKNPLLLIRILIEK